MSWRAFFLVTAAATLRLGAGADIVQTAVSAGKFTVLKSALDKAGLTSVLEGNGPFTVFAPTDAAFEALLKQLGVDAATLLARRDLRDILLFHVLGADVRSADLKDGWFAQTLQGARLPVKKLANGSVSIDGAAVTSADIACSNGVIHIISSVLLPPSYKTLAGGELGWIPAQWDSKLDGAGVLCPAFSRGSYRVDGDAMIFSGNLKSEKFFTRMRMSFDKRDFSSYAGLIVEMEAATFASGENPLILSMRLRDGSKYGFSAPFAVPFAASSGVGAQVFLPWSSFDRGNRRTSRCSTCRLDTSQVQSVEVYARYQSGDFEVRLRKIALVQEAAHGPAMPTMPAVPALAPSGMPSKLLEATIRSGAYIYDKGYYGSCSVMYQAAALAVIKAPGVSLATRGVLCAGVLEAQQSSASDHVTRAWVLRRVFDAVLADESGAARRSASAYPAALQGSWLPAKASAAGVADKCDGLGVLSRALPTPSNSVAIASPAGALTDSFKGPFEAMGISGHNDLGASKVSSAEECAAKCRKLSNCRSFDLGVRGKVVGECWLSTANRASAGSAYTSWALYDYYERTTGSKASKSILETAVAAGTFGTLKAALEKTNLVSVLSGPGPFTVLAPTDDAFGKLLTQLKVDAATLLARSDLADILKLHVASGQLLAADLTGGIKFESLQGKMLGVEALGGTVAIGGAVVETVDILCSNGVIHVLKSVLLPGSVPEDVSVVDDKDEAEDMLKSIMGSSFDGPFTEMGISGHNDLGEYSVDAPEECAALCKALPKCRSIDYGARGQAKGECWLSTATRASAGGAYSRWPLYDYYELKQTATPAAMASGMASKKDDDDDDDDDDEFVGSVGFWLIIGGGVVLILLVGIIAHLLMRLKKVSSCANPGIGNPEVVVGRPVTGDATEGKAVAMEGVPVAVSDCAKGA